MRRGFLFAPLLVLLGLLLTVGRCIAGGGPKNVLVVVNDNSPVSQRIAAYYKEKRAIPDRNICHIQCSADELVTKTECENNIVIPIRNFITNSGVHDRIDYIVLTKGIPLKASYNDTPWFGPVSVTSVLTCVGVPSIISFCTNPYGPTAYPTAPEQYFTHQLTFSGKNYYAVTRLDAYTEEQVYSMIDDSVDAQAQTGLFLLDGRYVSDPNSGEGKANTRLRDANHNLRTAGYTTYYDDTTFDSLINEFVGGQQNVMGYFSWGSNESSYTLAAYVSNMFRPGSIADTYVSSSGRSFTSPPTYGQSLIADLIPQGLTAGNGYVSEPDIKYASYPNVLFARYVQGYNMAESFLAATPRLYWKAVTVGDPLLAPYATPPAVTVEAPDTSRPAHGILTVSASATDASGIAKVEFYIDDQLACTCTSEPYTFSWSTYNYDEGMHVLEAIAYENTNVYTQGRASAIYDVHNIPTQVSSITQLADIPLGTLVHLSSKTVTAGTDVFDDCAYVAEPDRSAGIKVIGSFEAQTGTTVTVDGELDMIGGERVIQDAIVAPDIELLMVQPAATIGGGVMTEDENKALTPIGMPNRCVANRGSNIGPEYEGLPAGISNAALLVKTWGRVVEVRTDEFSISDGSLERRGAVVDRIKVSLRSLANPMDIPSVGTYVIVTGISCYTLEDEIRKPTVRPRTADDVHVVTQ